MTCRPMPYLGGGTLQPPPGSKPIEPSSQAQEVTPSTSDSDHRPNTSQHARHIQHHHYQDQHDQHMMSGPFMHGGPMFMRPGMSPMHMMPSGPMMFPPGMMPGPMMMMPPHGMMNGRMGPQVGSVCLFEHAFSGICNDGPVISSMHHHKRIWQCCPRHAHTVYWSDMVCFAKEL